jgi:hypothetical protein
MQETKPKADVVFEAFRNHPRGLSLAWAQGLALMTNIQPAAQTGRKAEHFFAAPASQWLIRAIRELSSERQHAEMEGHCLIAMRFSPD